LRVRSWPHCNACTADWKTHQYLQLYLSFIYSHFFFFLIRFLGRWYLFDSWMLIHTLVAVVTGVHWYSQDRWSEIVGVFILNIFLSVGSWSVNFRGVNVPMVRSSQRRVLCGWIKCSRSLCDRRCDRCSRRSFSTPLPVVVVLNTISVATDGPTTITLQVNTTKQPNTSKRVYHHPCCTVSCRVKMAEDVSESREWSPPASVSGI